MQELLLDKRIKTLTRENTMELKPWTHSLFEISLEKDSTEGLLWGPSETTFITLCIIHLIFVEKFVRRLKTPKIYWFLE